MRITKPNNEERVSYEFGAAITSWQRSDSQGGDKTQTWFLAGSINNITLTTGAASGNVLRAVPFFSPSRGGIIGQVAINVTTASAGSGIIGIYNNTASNIIYPSGIVYYSPPINTGTVGLKQFDACVKLMPGQLYWAVYWNNAGATLRALPVASIENVLGINSSFPTTPNLLYAYGMIFPGANALLNLPRIFPLGAVPATAVPCPAIYYRFNA